LKKIQKSRLYICQITIWGGNNENLNLLITCLKKNQKTTNLVLSNNNLSGNDLGNANYENIKLLANAIKKNKTI